MRERVPGYADFLSERDVAADADWNDLPLTDKRNYLLKHPIRSLCWDGSLRNCHLIGSSSGFSSTGSIFWPKRPEDEGFYLEAVERALISAYGVDEKRTLVLICLAFGTWIGGMQVAAALRTLAATGKYPLTVATPGLNLDEAAEIFENFSADYERTLWITNPSNINLIHAILETRRIRPASGTVSFPVVGEYFSESFRERVAAWFGHPQDAPFCVWTGYGSADTGDVAMETAATIALRKWFHRRPEVAREWFETDDVPMLLAPSPKAHVEIIDGSIVVSKDQQVPLARYDTGDAGGLTATSALREIDGLDDELLDALPDPILHVFGRAGNAVIFYGTNLMINDINAFFLELPSDFNYGGLFQVRPRDDDGVTVFEFTVSVSGGEDDASLAERYRTALIDFLQGKSLEFKAKHDPLSRSLGRPLIRLALKRVTDDAGQLKHKFIVED